MNGISRGLLMALGLAFASANAHASAYTAWAVPTSVELVNGGVLIEGAFGDPNNCGVGGYVFMSQSSTTFKEVVAMAYTALVAGKSLSFYAASCGQVSFHWGGNVINMVADGHTAAMR
jgi:hypothetical protein